MRTALVVDDIEENLYLLQAMLGSAGLSVTCAHDGVEALELARTSLPDIIVSDILMPGMDGFALCQECRRDDALRHVPFVFYTATYTDPRDEKLAMAMGADRFLVKPLEPDQLIAEIQAVLDRGTASSVHEPDAPDEAVMRQYNQALVRKLEDKLAELETTLEQRNESRRRLNHLNQVLTAIRSVNQLIVKDRDPASLVPTACRVLTETQGFRAAWLVAKTENGAPLLAAQHGFDDRVFEQLLDRIRAGDWPPCCRARHESPTAVANRLRECAPCPLADAHGEGSGVVTQLLHDGRCFGCLGVAVDREFAEIEEEHSLLEELAGDIAYALHSCEVETVRKESEQALSGIFANVRDGIVLADGETRRLLRVNPAICRMLGYEEEELLKLRVRDIHPAESFERVVEEFGRQLRGENDLARDLPVLRRDGTVFPADINATALVSQGRPCLLGVFRDMTERREAEEERARLQAQLNHSQRMESIGRLAGGVAHDFNNMLSVILGYAELALTAPSLDAELEGNIREVHQAAARSANLTRQLLAFARKQNVEPQVLDLNSTVGSMLKMLGRLIGEDISLTWVPGEAVWPVHMDPSQIDQVLANLCVNSRDAIEGGGTIVIETGNATFDSPSLAAHPRSLPGDYVQIAISDDGCGMDKETQSRIFEPFFTTKEHGKGTGLGLATVYGIVKQNNGFIDVYSEPDQGTTFRIYLPRHRATAEPVQKGPPEELSLRGNECILLVEDEPAILKMTRHMLERNGYTVLSAGSPAEAIRLADQHRDEIHLLMTDVIMPEMNGKELALRLREQRPSLRVLFMSGYMANVLVLRSQLDTNAAFVGKPFSIGELSRKVRKALGGSSEN